MNKQTEKKIKAIYKISEAIDKMSKENCGCACKYCISIVKIQEELNKIKGSFPLLTPNEQ
ncbi:MAG: hypothetical protein HQ538_06335 [Parcubacteria group bacterium]|nr:hypothetical protein [Parcubacteria group bacterium]